MEANSTLLAQLDQAIPTLPESRKGFAISLFEAGKKYGSWTEKQFFWVKKMIDPENPPGSEPVTNVGAFKKAYDLFVGAKVKLKHPKITLATQSGHAVVMYMAGDRSAQPGVLNVTDGGAYGNNVWYGRVHPTGVWDKGRKVSDDVLEDVSNLLKAFAENPAKMAKEHAVLTGKCCFCNAPLSDERSTAAGFGPVCAKNWGLKEEWKKASLEV